ncbi:MAG: DUF2802 domain-containing protein [Gammaproteobacteria bacterium]|nr:DUF2802 domain-containing protein [Gammaproteobacteria bacterium]
MTDTSVRGAEFAILLLLCGWLLLRLISAVRVAAVAKHARISAAGHALQAAQAECEALRANMAALTTCLAHLEQQVQHLSGRQNQLELRDPVRQTYEPAIRMVRKGADVEELVSTCGLARGEAELIMMLHRNAAITGEARCA